MKNTETSDTEKAASGAWGERGGLGGDGIWGGSESFPLASARAWNTESQPPSVLRGRGLLKGPFLRTGSTALGPGLVLEITQARVPGKVIRPSGFTLLSLSFPLSLYKMGHSTHLVELTETAHWAHVSMGQSREQRNSPHKCAQLISPSNELLLWGQRRRRSLWINGAGHWQAKIGIST